MTIHELFNHPTITNFIDTASRTPKSNLAIAILVTLVLAYIAHTAAQWYKLSHIPGPFWASVSKWFMVKITLSGTQPFAFKEVMDKYGPLARVGPNELLTSDPEVLRRMMSAKSGYVRGPWYAAFRMDPSRDNLFSTRDEVAHAKLRTKMAPGYSGQENSSMETTISTEITHLITLLSTKYISTPTTYRPVDFGQKAQYFTLDVISHLAFGQSFNYLKNDSDIYQYIKITDRFMPIMLTFSTLPSLTKILHSRVFRGLMPKESDKLGFGAFIGFANKVVAERFASTKPQRDMLASFIRHGLNQEEVSGEALLQIVAGSDTSATTIRIVLLHLLLNPPIYARLQKEIDDGITAGRISAPIKDSEARQMPYLQAVIKEGLRMRPPATGAFFKQVPPGGDVIDGKFIPAGTQVGTSSYSIQHSKETFGEDAEVFRPERWIEADSDRFEMMKKTVDMVFHSGRYQCLGKLVALMEFNKIFVELLRRFDFSIVNPEMPARIQNAGVWIIHDFWLRVTERQ